MKLSKEYSATCHFDSALESANMMVAPSMNKMPSGIRSARRLARWSRLLEVKGGPGEFQRLPSTGSRGRAVAKAYGGLARLANAAAAYARAVRPGVFSTRALLVVSARGAGGNGGIGNASGR